MRGEVWRVNGHTILCVEVRSDRSSMLLCSTCGARAHKRVKTGEGLAGPCGGANAPGLTQCRARIKAGKHPDPAQGKEAIGPFKPVPKELKAEWATRLGTGPAAPIEGPKIRYGERPLRATREQVLSAFGFRTGFAAAEYGKECIKRERQDKKLEAAFEGLDLGSDDE